MSTFRKLDRIISTLLALSICISILPTSALGISSISDEDFSGGSGTNDNPYVISTAKEFQKISTQPDAHYILAADLTLPDNNRITSFSGTLDGDGHSLNVTYNNSCGLFDRIEKSGVVKNLTVNISSNSKCGSFYDTGGFSNTSSAYWGFGSICYVNYGTIDNCIASGILYENGNPNSLKSVPVAVGGICAISPGGTITLCRNNIDITLTGPGYNGISLNSARAYVGGISGRDGIIKNCLNTGDIKVYVTDSSVDPAWICGVGGIEGSDGSGVSNCASASDILFLTYYSRSGTQVMRIGLIYGYEFTSTQLGIFGSPSRYADECMVSENCSAFVDYYGITTSTLAHRNVTYTNYTPATKESIEEWWDGLHSIAEDPDNPITDTTTNIYYFNEWDAENQIAYFEDELLNLGAEATEATDTSFLDTVQDMVGHYVLVETKARDDGMIGPDILIRMELVEAGTGTIQERTEDSLTIHDTVYPLALKGEEPLFGAGKDDEVLYGVQDGKIVILVPLTTTTMRLEDWDPDSRVLTVSSDLTTYTYKVSTLASEESLAFLNADKEPDKSYNIEFAYDLSGKSVYRIYRIYMESGDEDTSYKDGTFEYLSYDNHIREYTYHYDESWFWNSSYTYQHDLTRMSLRVAMAAGDIRVVDGQADADGARPLKNLMSDLGFTYSEEYSHYPIPEYDSIGYGIGSKTITSPSGEEATLIMVAIRGSGYKSEWGGNFRIGTDMDHMGFRLAANQVIEGLKNYINANTSDFKPNVKVWISGFSRAAATTNLVAAYLDDGNFAEINPDNVFAFCFECPRNTKNTDVTNSRYNNIINIVNPNDLVTKVAMRSWGFSRYGKTYLIPTRDTDSMYLKLKGDMQLEYVKILASLENTPDVVLDLTTDYVNQSDVLNKFVLNLGNALKNEEYYVLNYQNDIVENVAKLLGQGKTGGLLPLLDVVRDLIGSKEFELNNSISAVAQLADGAFYAHNPELCMAWLDSLEFTDTTSEELWMYRKLLINCPVDIAIYDASEQSVAQIIDGKPQEIANGLSAYVDCNGQNIIVLPANGEYTVKLKATDDGTVTYTIAEYSADSGLCNRITSYYTVAVTEGDELYGTIENLANVSEAQYPLISSDGETIIPTVTQTGSEVKSYTVNVSLIGGGSVSGGGIFTSGEYAKVVATPDKEYVFDGWYIGNRLVSKDLEYRFLVDGNITISAVFAENSTSHTMTYVEAIQATCCSTGILAHWHCSECNKDFSDADGTTEVSSIVIPIDPTNHAGGTEVRNAVEATYESEGYTGDTYCLGCNAKIADGTVIPKKTQSGSTSSGGGTSTYTITLEKFENGTVTASHKQAPHGTTVTLTITPEEGFTLESLTVRDRNDNMIRVTSKTETIYSFTMPSSPVQIAAVFSQAINDPDTPLGDLPFLDVSPEAWYKNAVGYVFENGLMSGTSSTTFSPDITTSRGMIVTTLYRLEQNPSVSESSDFSDVEDGQWYSDAIVWASANDIVSGYGNGMFGPDDPVTREQMATILYRYAQFKGYPTTSSADLSKYTDLELLSTWAQEPMKWANVFGIITGTTATTLNPQGNATRAEMAAMLMRFCENIAAV